MWMSTPPLSLLQCLKAKVRRGLDLENTWQVQLAGLGLVLVTGPVVGPLVGGKTAGGKQAVGGRCGDGSQVLVELVSSGAVGAQDHHGQQEAAP